MRYTNMVSKLYLTTLVSLLHLTRGGSVPQGGPCSLDNSRLDISSHRFISDCTDQTFCSGSANGTCEPRQCRRDEFPFGFPSANELPPLCSPEQYCPDEGSACRDLIPVGQPCQFNRDDQCSPPDNWSELANNQNFNGSLCLQSTCVYANASLGQRCILDTTTYVDLGPDFGQYTSTILRHNCRTPNFYCDTNALQCLRTKTVGSLCSADPECASFNCESRRCTDPPEMPVNVATWQYAIVVAFVLMATIVTVVMLVMIHKRIRLKHYSELREYYEEQLSLRRSMFALYAAAAEGHRESEKRGSAYVYHD